MSLGLIVDIVIIGILFIAFFAGWRQGAVSSVLSTIGVIAGLICGAVLAPLAMQLSDSQAMRFILALGVLVLLVGIGNMAGAAIGAAFRDGFLWKRLRGLDSLIGACFQTAAALLVVWLVSIPIASGLRGQLPQAVQESKVLAQVDRMAPGPVKSLPSKISAMLNDSGLPPLVSPFTQGNRPVVDAPDIQVSDEELVRRLRPSVIHVLGESQRCARTLMGSGFAVDNQHVITNAHVVAGTQTVSLDTVLGLKEAQVVYYNPEMDIAVLATEELDVPALQWAPEPAQTGDDAIVLGFPQSGPYTASPARINDRITISGPNIYAGGRVEREAYTVRGNIRQGNSGGPLVDANGNVLGVVFGASVDSSDIGYALTARQVQEAIGDIGALQTPVDTQECVAH
ncbi:MarP family serine protease [Corynebacterium pseudopelargi]|uniref:Serine protease n=1 Tax=Corynebacterium pseudopelargi TaxID=2080757 RepID=A0A3G6IZR8_9CORY|nr:MarP family serine protease [Corynebacterium pseudopelargi]AZA10178.1 Serine protease [Corynebacterium pseudopelargi]